jgi:hypothetical protein
MWIRFRIAIVLFVFGVMAIVFGVYEWRLSSGASTRPEEISLRDLIARGPDGNPNIILKDFELLDDNLVYEYDEKLGPNSSWTKVWVPVVPPGAAPPGQPGGFPFNPQPQRQIGQVQALIYSTHVHGQAEIRPRCGVPKLRAMVTNRVQSLGSEEKKLLQEGYPGTDFNKCLIIEEGREPASAGFLVLLFGGGLLLLAGGAGLLVIPWLLGKGGGGTTQLPRKLRPRRKRRDEEEGEDEDEGSGTSWRPPAEERLQDRPRRRRPAAEDEDEAEDDEPPRRPRRRPAEE